MSAVPLFIKDLLDADETKTILEICSRQPTSHVSVDGYARSYRNNYRAIFDDRELAERLFAKILPALEQNDLTTVTRPYSSTSSAKPHSSRFQDDSYTWDLIDLNPHWRYCYYETGGVFGRHRDTRYTPPRAAGEPYIASQLTVMFYLNSDFEGGSTRFYEGHFRAAGLETLDIKGEAGSCVIFPHELLHDGQLVTRGPKHILRTEAMFRKR